MGLPHLAGCSAPAAIGAVLGLVLAHALSRSLVGDVQRIRATAVRVARGDLSLDAPVARGDEIGDLAQAVDEMVRELERARRERRGSAAARQHFLTAIGHDLRTPLTALQVAVEALEDGVAPDPAEYLRAMRRDVDALRTLVDDLFLLARIEEGKLELPREHVDLAELADEAVEALAPIAREHDVSLRVSSVGPAPATGGPDELGRVIRNLIANAITHAPSRSDVSITTSNGSDGAVVRVVDEGPGFPPDLAARAFESFVRGDEARSRRTGGAGLGLAVARGLVEAYGGRIWIEPGHGGHVAFTLPPVDGRRHPT